MLFFFLGRKCQPFSCIQIYYIDITDLCWAAFLSSGGIVVSGVVTISRTTQQHTPTHTQNNTYLKQTKKGVTVRLCPSSRLMKFVKSAKVWCPAYSRHCVNHRSRLGSCWYSDLLQGWLVGRISRLLGIAFYRWITQLTSSQPTQKITGCSSFIYCLMPMLHHWMASYFSVVGSWTFVPASYCVLMKNCVFVFNQLLMAVVLGVVIT